MGLGSRSARRHETAKTAGVNPEDYWAYRPGESVMTTDGFLGTVTAVNDGPIAGVESYIVSLANGLGGGEYSESQLRPATSATASQASVGENTAALDYPELEEILQTRVDPGRYPERKHGSLQATAEYFTVEELRAIGQAAVDADPYGRSAEEILRAQAGGSAGMCENGHLTWDDKCASCRNTPVGDGPMVTNPGDNKPNPWRPSPYHGINPPEPLHPDDNPDWVHRYSTLNATAGMGGMPVFQVGDRVVNFRGESPGTVTYVGDSGHPGKSNRVTVATDDGYEDGGYESAWKIHPDAPDHQRAWHEQRKADNQAASDLFSSIEEQHENVVWPRHSSTKWSSLVDHGYALIAQAAVDSDFGFHITAAWRDVRNKAKRIRSEGGVHITTSQNGYLIAQVKGDTSTYESVIMRAPGTQKVAQWDCGCTWAKYHWGAPDDFSRFSGRMCSHVLALNLEAQARGMFGKSISEDTGAPKWLVKRDMALTSAREDGNWPDHAPIHLFAVAALMDGEDPADLALLLGTVAHVNAPFGEPGPSQVPGIVNGATSPRREENPASAGFLTAAEPDGWGHQMPSNMDSKFSSLDDAVFEPEIVTEAALDPKEAWAQLLIPIVRAVGPKVVEKVAPSLMRHLPGMDDEQEDDQEGQSGPGFVQTVKNWTDRDKAEGQNALRNASLHDEPEPALPSTDGAEGDLDDSGQTWSGYAGDPDPDPPRTDYEAMRMGLQDDVSETREDLGLPPLKSSVDTGTDYLMPGEANGGVGSALPSSNFATDPTSLEPEDPSFVSTGSTGGAQSVNDIVAAFQATAGHLGGQGDSGAGRLAASRKNNSDLAMAAKAYLSGGQEALTRTAMAVFTPAEQQALINEGDGGPRARNFDSLQIEGTHYAALEDALSRIDDDSEDWMA